MNKTINHGLIMSLLFFVNCNGSHKKENEAIVLEFKKFADIKSRSELDSIQLSRNCVSFFKYGKEDKLLKIKISLLNKQYGHYFEFTETGDLSRYYYLLDSTHDHIEIKTDSSLHEYSELGTPFVDYMENISDSLDKKKYSLLFSEFPRKNLIVYLSKDGQRFDKIDLHASKIMPLLKEADIYCGPGTKKIYLKIDANNLILKLSGLSDSKSFLKTIILEEIH